jgi:hypothetical protein
VGGDLDAGLNPFVEHERVAMKRRELWGEHRAETFPTAAPRGSARPAAVGELAGHAIGAEGVGAGDAGGVEHERGGPPAGELRDPAEWAGVLERPVGFGVVDSVPGDRFGGGAPSAAVG